MGRSIKDWHLLQGKLESGWMSTVGCVWESSTPVGRHTDIFSLSDPETCGPNRSPCRTKPSVGEAELITSPVPYMCIPESPALPSRLSNHMYDCGTHRIITRLLREEGIGCGVLRNFPYFSCAKHCEGAGDTFEKPTCPLAIYMTVFPDQGSLTKFQGFGKPESAWRLYLNTRRLHVSGERVQAFISSSNRSEGEETVFKSISLNWLEIPLGPSQLSELRKIEEWGQE